jgi:DNA-binding transcriptional LysR family regulator
VAERIDLAVRTTPEPPESMVARKLDDDVRYLCASPAYLAERGTPQTPADLSKHDCVPARIKGRVVPWRFKSADESTRNYMTHDPAALQLNNMMSIRAAALAGMGIAELPRFLAARDIDEGRLVQVLQSFPRVQRAIYVIYTPSPFLPAKVRLLVDALRNSVRAAPADSLEIT